MPDHQTLTHTQLKAPRSAAIAGILFSILLMASMLLLRISIPADPMAQGTWLERDARQVILALNLIPFAGVAFLWYVGVLRDRLGAREDRFFATVFLGSGFLFLGLLFVSAAVVGGIVTAHRFRPEGLPNSAAFFIARAITYNILNIYAVKMASVFMLSTSVMALRTGFVARWIAILGVVLAIVLLVGSYWITWSFMVFPIWVLVMSTYILADNLRRTAA